MLGLPPRLTIAEGIMRIFKVLLGLFILSVATTPRAGAAKLGETCDGVSAIACDAELRCEHPAELRGG
jgi:hypothetical protein